jgi:predicted nucleic acid-binding protein
MTVVDASVVADAIRGTGGPSHVALSQAEPPIAAPELLDLEVASTYRKLVAAGVLVPEQGRELLERLRILPLTRHGHTTLLPRIWKLRGALSAYDAAYIALAERLGAVLLTRDSVLANASGIHCRVELVG